MFGPLCTTVVIVIITARNSFASSITNSFSMTFIEFIYP